MKASPKLIAEAFRRFPDPIYGNTHDKEDFKFRQRKAKENRNIFIKYNK